MIVVDQVEVQTKTLSSKVNQTLTAKVATIRVGVVTMEVVIRVQEAEVVLKGPMKLRAVTVVTTGVRKKRSMAKLTQK